jgi:hypothetical protein
LSDIHIRSKDGECEISKFTITFDIDNESFFDDAGEECSRIHDIANKVKLFSFQDENHHIL